MGLHEDRVKARERSKRSAAYTDFSLPSNSGPILNEHQVNVLFRVDFSVEHSDI